MDGTLSDIKTGTAGDWSEFLRSDKLHAWNHEVRQEDNQRKNIVQQTCTTALTS